jgi:molybdenum cofactor cytidylyltransferase
MPREPRLSAVVLAAGLSLRMGPRNKLLLPIGDVPLVRRSVVTILESHPFAEVIVVTGHESTRVEDALRGLGVRLVFNPHYEEGQMASVRAGLARLGPSPVAGVMVCLADQPSLTAADLRLIGEQFVQRVDRGRPCPVLVPTFGGVRGNPIVLASASLPDILSRGGNFGCKQFVAKNADVVATFEMPNNHVLVDLDHPEDYAALENG